MIPIDPNMNTFWFLPPLVFVISVVFSATRFEAPRAIAIHSVRFAVYILSFLLSVYVFLYIVQLDLMWYWYIPVVAAALYFLFWPSKKKTDPNADAKKDSTSSAATTTT